ncbi:hypothetical protein J4457_00105, partial [Candidatus Woesearchaeota archaeon]|nr:hypothetical protein [Candidatus Woesearchaeota archaeon]
SDSTAQEDKQQRDFLFSIERIVNAIHGAVGSRLAYRSSPREAREYARQHMPYIFLHTPFHGLDGTINNLLGVIGANIMHSHIGKRINNFAAETLEEHRGLIEAWQPNVVYYYIAHAEAVPHVIELSKALPGSTFFVAHPNLNKSVLLVLNGLSNVVVEPRPNRGIIAERLAEQWHKYLGRLRNTHVYKIRGVTRNVSQHLREVQASDLEGALSQQFKFEEGKPTPVCTAVPVYPGASSGRLFTSETYDRICSAVEAKQRGERVILYVEDLASLDLSTVKMARGLDGLIFRRVSQENHHVVDLRRSGIPMIQLREGLLESTIDGFTLSRSQPISFDGSTGEIFSGQYRTVPSQLAPAKLLGDQNLRGSAERYQTALRDADGILSDLGKQIFINADTTEQMVKARDWGVCSVGLVRSEGILKRNREALIIYGRFLLSLANDQSNTVPEQEFIASQREVYERILSFQRGERTQIRLLDPPIHELFSASVALETRASYGRKFGSSVADNALTDRKESLRGAQLLGKFSGIYRAQLRALFDAYNSVITKEGVDSDLRIFIPYVEDVEQVRRIKAMADDINQKEFGDAIRYELGVTLETIGGCIAAGDMIRDLRIKNFAIGSNDLFPFIDGTADRYSGQLAYVGNASDGTPLLKPAIRAFLERTLDLIVDAAKEADLDVNVGLCGEMNSVKLHPENLGPLLHRFDYLSASRPKQIPVITLLWAQTLHKLYGCPQSPSN